MNKDITLEDLGYKLITNNEKYLSYVKEFVFPLGRVSILEIIFDFSMKDVQFFHHQNDNFLNDKPYTINVQLLQAIYNKCKELGWLDEN